MSSDLADTCPASRIRHHYEVEKELATRLRKSNRDERTELFKNLYHELFQRVPDHPRLVRRETPEELQRKVKAQLRLVRPHLSPETTLVEFAPGDCGLSHAASPLCKRVIGIDISDQRANPSASPENFELIIYDGYECGLPDNSADAVYSCMFLEHLHPDDIQPHLRLAWRLLKPGGVYVIWTPHRYSGPHDVSRHFGNDLVCFHFQEWTVGSLKQQLRQAGFERAWIYRGGRMWKNSAVNRFETFAETCCGWIPAVVGKPLNHRFFRAVIVAGEKPGNVEQVPEARPDI